MKILKTLIATSIVLFSHASFADSPPVCDSSFEENISMAVKGMALSHVPYPGEGYTVKFRYVGQSSEGYTFEAVRILLAAPFPNCIYSPVFKVKVDIYYAFGGNNCTIN